MSNFKRMHTEMRRDERYQHPFLANTTKTNPRAATALGFLLSSDGQFSLISSLNPTYLSERDWIYPSILLALSVFIRADTWPYTSSVKEAMA